MRKFLVILCAAISLLSCNENSREKKVLDEIKEVGNHDPLAALVSYDSIRGEMEGASDYIYNRYELLGVRLHDKADILPTSDSCIRRLVAYFEQKGNNADKQEAYYYAGSVYRDLQDSPRALEYFLRSADCAAHGKVDSVLLRNCYSQLSGVYYRVQDYENSLWAAKRECAVAKELGILDDISLIHQVNAYSQLDRRAEALDLMQEILESQSQMPPSRRSGGLLYDLLHDFCEEQDVPSAEKCVNLLKQTDAFPPKGRLCLSYAKYCKLIGHMDSCIYYCRMALVPDDSIGVYEALRRLFYIYDSQDNKALTLEYAREFMDLSTDMDWGRRQELAATVNNQYKYYKNREVEDRLQKERDNLRVYLWIVLTLSLLMMVAAFILHLVRKEKRLKSLHGLNGVVNSLRRYQGIEPEPAMENKRLRSEDAYIVRMKFNLIESENCFGQVTENLAEAKQQIKQKDEELAEAGRKIQQKEDDLARIKELFLRQEQQLEETKRRLAEEMKISQERHERCLALLAEKRKRDFAEEWPELVEKIRKAIKSCHSMTDEEWEKIINVFESKHPEFFQRLEQSYKSLRSGMKKGMCLFALGYDASQVCVLTGAGKSSVYRWAEVYAKSVDPSASSSEQEAPKMT